MKVAEISPGLKKLAADIHISHAEDRGYQKYGQNNAEYGEPDVYKRQDRGSGQRDSGKESDFHAQHCKGGFCRFEKG